MTQTAQEIWLKALQSSDYMNCIVRELEERDLDNGFLETLETLRDVGNVDNSKAKAILGEIKSNTRNKIFVAVADNGKVIGSTTLIVERKFIRGGGLVGHIEDVVTHKGFQRMGVGSSLINKAVEFAKSVGCYKIILNCNENNVPFYEKLGFKKHEIEMRLDL